jgi:hypothetical protein
MTPDHEKQDPGGCVTLADVRELVDDIDELEATAIIATGATRAELEEACLYARGEGDRVDRAGHPLTGVVADIYEILAAKEDKPARER